MQGCRISTTRTPSLALATTLVLAYCAIAPSCSSPPRPSVEQLRQSPLGERLDELWQRHGGVETWTQHAAASFRLVVEGPAGRLELPAVLIVFSRPDSVWVSDRSASLDDPYSWVELSLTAPVEPGGDEAAIRWTLAERLGLARDVFDSQRPGAGDLDYALRSLSSLFCLPFAITQGAWSLRRPLGRSPGDEPGRQFEARPAREPLLLGPFLVPDDPSPASGALERLLYFSRHPLRKSSMVEVRLGSVERVGGVLVSRLREHLASRPGSVEHRRPEDAFLPDATIGRELRVFLREELHELSFATAAQTEAFLTAFDGDP